MNKPIFIYLDDESDESVEAAIAGFNDQGLIEVKPLNLIENMTFDDVKERLLAQEFDGIIMDLKLDGNTPNRLKFRAPTLAQDLRTYAATEIPKLSVPYVLCSTEKKMKATYDIDKTSHDLFDYKFLKEVESNWYKMSIKLSSLAGGYKLLQSEEFKLDSIFGRADLNNLDPRIIDKFYDPSSLRPHDYAQFIIKELFHHPGPLLNERLLAARLGIDLERSEAAWCKVKDEMFAGAKYTGIFSDGWDRWWADVVINIFKQSTEKRLATLNARERVEELKAVMKLDDLLPADPISPYCVSNKFWAICELTKKPLDPLEGFKVQESNVLKPWQDAKYLSFEAVASREGESKGLRPQASEMPRIQIVKEEFRKK